MSSIKVRPGSALKTRRSEADSQSNSVPSFHLGVFTVGGGSLISLLVLLVEAVIIARILSVADLGIYALLLASLGFLVIVVDFGFKTSATQFIASSPAYQQDRIVNGVTIIRLVAIAGISLLIWLVSATASRLMNAPDLAGLLLFMPVVLLFASLDELQDSLLRGFRRYKHIAAARVLRGTLRLTLSSLVLLAFGWGLMGLMISWAVSFAASAAFQWHAVPVRRKWWFRWSTVQPILRFGIPVQLNRYLWFAFGRVHTIILAALAGPVGVAFYAVAARLPEGLQRLFLSYDAIYHPTLVSHFERKEREEAATIIRRSLRLFNFVTIFFVWGAVLFGEDLIELLFGERYAGAAHAFVIMLIALSLSSSANLLGYALTAHGRPEKSLVVNCLRAAVSLTAGILLIRQFGFVGAAYATALSILVSVPLAWWYLHRERLPALVPIHAKQILLLAACAAALFLLPSVAFGMRVILLLMFPLVAAILSLLSFEDLSLVIPDRFLERARLRVRVFSHQDGA